MTKSATREAADELGIDDNATSTAITIDASENVGIGTSSPAYLLDVVGDSSTQVLTRVDNTNQSTNTGSGIRFDSSVVGGTQTAQIYTHCPANNTVNLIFEQEINGTNGVVETMRIDSSGDLVLSGGVYLGGTGAANKLDDYESGTWNPSENNGVTLTDNETPRYTKVGDMVHLWFDVTVATNTNGNSFDLSGIPFTANDMGCAGGAVYYCNMNNSLANAGLSFHFGTTTRAALRSGYDATVPLADMSGHRISGVLIYKATA